ncbi:aminoglycoside 6'-N-acetyltransferase [Neolewinella litorea]|uniref:Aminoglycoside N(6')-acetyltransferase type 1 n=1 Tax=Neolewinella litorea TaxID=2562452 RepID=A0A4S4N8X7_9BACT|nr:aminoglycoside 6'-N-acetyltransferase [Neolewinella litorea]THH35599.1 GNAT family N-acetyltransferase [Neolewinella litorea]
MEIITATEAHLPALAEMAVALWPETSYAGELAAARDILADPYQDQLIALAGEAAIGFVQLSLRTDYVEGATSLPVAYIEGVYVSPAWRGRGVGRALVQHAEIWGREKGCTEIASDTEWTNRDSIAFHGAAGFREVKRVVCFVKSIDRPTGGHSRPEEDAPPD